MGYNLSIGQATIEWSEDFVTIEVEAVELPDAPAFGEFTDYTNKRWPSYSAWSEFARQLDLHGIFAERHNDPEVMPEALIQSHPGVAPITQAHVDYVQQKIDAYKAAHPTHRAEFPKPKPGAVPVLGEPGKANALYREEDLIQDPESDGMLARAEWLIFWLRWAVKNCSEPVFVNT